MQAGPSSIDPADLAKFERLAAQWWRADGPMGQLHKLNPVRLAFIRDHACRHFGMRDAKKPLPLAGLRVLDIGCGGGILCEPLARLGAGVTGIDPGPGNIGMAVSHAAQSGLDIDYRAVTAESLAATGGLFDIVLAMEVVEHVTDMAGFVGTACSLAKPGGLFFAATLNRTLKSFALAIVGAEYILRWLPAGTHNWNQFVTPEELCRPVRRAGLKVLDTTGVLYDPLTDSWRAGKDMDVNYMVMAGRGANRETTDS